LVYASIHGDIDLVKFLHKKGAIVDHEDAKQGQTALDHAAAHGHLDIVKYLHAVEVSLTESWSGNEMMWAAAHDQADMIKAQIAKGADIEAVDDFGNTVRNVVSSFV
jgi:ankyrin repeat protein